MRKARMATHRLPLYVRRDFGIGCLKGAYLGTPVAILRDMRHTVRENNIPSTRDHPAAIEGLPTAGQALFVWYFAMMMFRGRLPCL